VEKASQKVCGGKLNQPSWSVFFFGGAVGEGTSAILQYFWGKLRRTCFPAKSYLFYEIKKLKEEKEREKKYIRSLKICLLFLKKYFTWDQWFFFWNFLQIFNLKNLILTYAKDCLYVEMAQIRQNLIIKKIPDLYNRFQQVTLDIDWYLNLLTFISSL